ncbi:MAG TPA: hypothetical protein VMV18_13765 [bacterium]|nr:hypothetical protein [bacterium]
MPRRVLLVIVLVLFVSSPAWAKTKAKKSRATPTPTPTVSASPSPAASPAADASPAPTATPAHKSAKSKTVRDEDAGDLSLEEKSAWHAVLLDAFPDAGKTVAVVSRTAVDSNRGHHDLWKALRYLRIEIPDLTEATTDDFELSNGVPHALPRLDGAGKVELVAWKAAPLSMDEWHKFHAIHPEANALAILSRVGFSPDRNQALAYLELACGDWCGGGNYYVLRSTGEEHGWTVDRKYQSWDFKELWSAPILPDEKSEKTATDLTKP